MLTEIIHLVIRKKRKKLKAQPGKKLQPIF